jgi:SAM-dependent methyltransferase
VTGETGLADVQALFQAMRDSGMNDWVGGSDPEAAGDASTHILLRHIPIDSSSRVLDFGAGIGRVMVSLLKNRPQMAAVTGVDIVPSMVDFCRTTIGASYPNSQFELLAADNDHYERYKNGGGPRALSREELTAKLGPTYDAAYAFSVFTHVDRADFVPLLKLVASLLKPGGRFLFSCFILTHFSRRMLDLSLTTQKFIDSGFDDDRQVFIGSRFDRLAFIAYDQTMLDRMVIEAGLVPCAIEYGCWRGGMLDHGYQDLILCRKPGEQG